MASRSICRHEIGVVESVELFVVAFIVVFIVVFVVVFIVALCSSLYSSICTITCSSICSIFTSLPSVQDRCVSEPGYCSQLCQDSMTEGRKCSCNLGYSLAPDGRTCGGQYSDWYTSLS